MHVRIAWEILHHQKKENPEKTGATPSLNAKSTPDLHRPPSHMFPSGVMPRPHELGGAMPGAFPGRTGYETAQIPSGFLAGPTSHIGKNELTATRSRKLTETKFAIIFFLLFRKCSFAIRTICVAVQQFLSTWLWT